MGDHGRHPVAAQAARRAGRERHHGRGGRPALRRWGQQQERLQGPQPRDVRGHAQPENPQAQDGKLLPWIGNTYLDDFGRDSPASLNSTGDM